MSKPAPPVLRLVETTTGARTYRFRPEDRDLGWALVTINDATGEVLICSDWGNYTEIFGRSGLGTVDVTHFLARYDAGSFDYLVNRFLGRAKRTFCSDATVDRLRERLIDLRREDISLSGRKPPHPCGYFTHDDFEAASAELEELRDIGQGEQASALFWERLPDKVTELISDIHESFAEVETSAAQSLREILLPAIVRVCADELERRFRAQGMVQQLVQAALDGARSDDYRRTLPACGCNARSNLDCAGPSTFPVGTRCGYWGSLCGGRKEHDPHGARSRTPAPVVITPPAKELARVD